jgi:hypothetical protein
MLLSLQQLAAPAVQLVGVKSMETHIACVDSSEFRRQELCAALREAGCEVWRGRDVRDLLLLATTLNFRVVVADQSSLLRFPELWAQVDEMLPEVPVLVHSALGNGQHHARNVSRRVAIAGDRPELIVVMLTLLLENGAPEERAVA